MFRLLTEVTKGSQKLRLVVGDALAIILVPSGEVNRPLNLLFFHFRLFWHYLLVGTPNQKNILDLNNLGAILAYGLFCLGFRSSFLTLRRPYIFKTDV